MDKGRPTYSRERERERAGFLIQFYIKCLNSWRQMCTLQYLQDQQAGARETSKFQTNNLKQGFQC